MKCTLCNERNGNTRCEGCNTLFCLPCMNKHHDELTQQFQLLMDVRNEVKQSLDISRSTSSNRKELPCLIEIDDWERKTIQCIQQIATNARTNVNELMMKHMNEICDRFEQVSVRMQRQQKEGDYLENDIERIKKQLDQLKNDITDVNEKIRVDSSISNNIEWDTLIYVVEEELSSKSTSEAIQTEDKVSKERKKLVLNGKVYDLYQVDSSNPEEMRRYFLEQIQQGEDCLSRGDLDNGVDHLAKAVTACSQPQSLMSLFQQTLPAELFQEIIMRLPRVAQSVLGTSSSILGGGGGGATLTEPDLE